MRIIPPIWTISISGTPGRFRRIRDRNICSSKVGVRAREYGTENRHSPTASHAVGEDDGSPQDGHQDPLKSTKDQKFQ